MLKNLVFLAKITVIKKFIYEVHPNEGTARIEPVPAKAGMPLRFCVIFCRGTACRAQITTGTARCAPTDREMTQRI